MSNIGRTTGVFNTPASGTTVITVDDAFAIHLVYTRVTADDTIQAHQVIGHGFAAGSNADCGMTHAEDGANHNQRDGRNANCILITDPTDDSDDVLAAGVTFNAGNVTIAYTTFSANFRIHYEIWHGTDGSVETREVGADTSPISDLTMTTPDMVLGFCLGQQHPASSIHGYQSFGVAVDNAGIDQWCLFTYMGDSDTDSVGSALVDGEFAGQYNVDFPNWTIQISAIGSNGCTWTGTNGDHLIFLFLDLAGDGVHVDTFAKSTATAPTTQQMPTFGFTPDGYSLATANFDLQTINTNRLVHASFGMYAEGDGGNSVLSVGTASSNADRASKNHLSEVLQGSDALQANGVEWSATPDAITDATPSFELNPNTTGGTDDVIIGVYGHELQAADITVTPGDGTLTITGLAPSVEITHIRRPGIDTLVITGFAPTVNVNFIIEVPAGSLTITGLAPTAEITHVRQPAFDTLILTGRVPTVVATANHIRAPPTGSLALTGHVPSVNITVQPGVGALTLSGQAPTTEITHVRQPPAGSLALSGLAPTIATEIAVPVGSLILTGRVPVVSITSAITVPKGSLALTGFAPTVEIASVRQPGSGTLAITGQAPTLDAGIAVPVGSLALTGFAPSVEITHIRRPGVGSLILTGQQPTVQLGGNIVRSPNTGSLVLTGFAPSVEITHIRRPGAGALALTGQAPTLDTDIPVPKGSLALTGFAPSVEITHVRQPPTGSLILSGKIPTIQTDTFRLPDSGSLSLTGFAPSVEITHIRQPGVGSLIITGLAPVVGAARQPGTGSLILTGFAPIVQVTDLLVPAPGVGSLILTGFAPSVEIAPVKTPGTGSLLITGFAPTTITAFSIPVPVGSLILTGQAPQVFVRAPFKELQITIDIDSYDIGISISTYSVDITCSTYTIDISHFKD